MDKWLFDILKDNTLVDNQIYKVDDKIFTNKRLPQPIPLTEKGKRYNAANNLPALWRFLNETCREIQKQLFTNKLKSLVLFNSKDYEHNSDDNFFEINGIDCMNFTLKTGNIIGYVKKGDYAIKICSRFGDNFLKYIISDADGFLEIENLGGTNEKDGYEWLLIYLWKTKIRKAYRLGIPKQYTTVKEKSSRVRGNLDPIHYFTVGRGIGVYDCKYREHSYNNEVTRLIAETFRKIGNHEFLHDCNLIKNAFYIASEGNKLNKAELYRTKHFTNPFYKDYNDVIDLSKMILRDQLSDFGDESEASAFFFDVSMLFEYFIKKLLKRSGYVINSKYENRYTIPTGVDTYKRNLEPDIVFNHKGKAFVFDVKYKNFDFVYGAAREDLFQLHTYVGQYGNTLKVKACGFIYPISFDKWKNKKGNLETPVIKDKVRILDHEIDFYILFVIVPEENDPKYRESFEHNIKALIEQINLITD